MMTDRSDHSDLAVPPGEYLEEVLEELGMTKDELAKRLDCPASIGLKICGLAIHWVCLGSMTLNS